MGWGEENGDIPSQRSRLSHVRFRLLTYECRTGKAINVVERELAKSLVISKKLFCRKFGDIDLEMS